MVIQFFQNHDIANDDSWLNSKLSSWSLLECGFPLYATEPKNLEEKSGCPHLLLVEMWNDAAIVEKSLAVPQKLSVESLYDPEIPPPRYILKKTKRTCSCSHKDIHVNVHSLMIHNSPKVETTHTPTDRWTDNQNIVCPYNGI